MHFKDDYQLLCNHFSSRNRYWDKSNSDLWCFVFKLSKIKYIFFLIITEFLKRSPRNVSAVHTPYIILVFLKQWCFLGHTNLWYFDHDMIENWAFEGTSCWCVRLYPGALCLRKASDLTYLWSVFVDHKPSVSVLKESQSIASKLPQYLVQHSTALASSRELI